MSRRPIALTLLLAAWFLVSTATALAKGDAIATLDASLPSDPEPGSEIMVGWTVETLLGDGTGTRAPFNAEGMFIRLSPATGEPVEAIGRQDTLGHYVATVRVPTGGIAEVAIGLRGESCSGGTCQRSDMIFAIDDSAMPVFAVAPPAKVQVEGAAPLAAETPAQATSPVGTARGLEPWAIVGIAAAAASIFVALGFLRVRGRPLTPGSSRS
jgi:hypothetical protein